ncbi:MAG: 30S ribosome-binding factor RbfA [Mycoplasmataceae bacterium]|jgi:ribosome-binding factor A|nr:30S ribosome-binding factor RbfA [Mycoplasmataceae bacterium]
MHKEIKNKIVERQHERYESLILNILNHALKNEIYNEDLKQVCFTCVTLSNGNNFAKIYVDCHERQNIEAKIKKLNLLKAPFKTQIAKLSNFKKTPEIHFVKDESIDNFYHINNLLGKIK